MVDARPHWIALVGPAFVTILLLVAVILAFTHIHGHGTPNRVLRWVLWVAAILLLIVYPLREFIRWLTSHFVVTNQRIIHRQGWISKTSMEVPLQRINDVRFHQGILERMVGAGDLIIESAGTRGQEVFSDIRHPEDMQRTIYERAQARESPVGGPSAPLPAPAPAASSSTSEELARLADLRDRGVLTEEEFQAQKARVLGEPTS